MSLKYNRDDNKRMYVEIDTYEYQTTGEICIISTPETLYQLLKNRSESQGKRGTYQMVNTRDLSAAIRTTGKRGVILSNIIEGKNISNLYFNHNERIRIDPNTKENISRTLCYKYLKELEDKEMITRTGNCYMLKPSICHYGDSSKEHYLYLEFQNKIFEKENMKKNK